MWGTEGTRPGRLRRVARLVPGGSEPLSSRTVRRAWQGRGARGGPRDAEGAIAADPTFAKAWVRKGNALLALGRYASQRGSRPRPRHEPDRARKASGADHRKCAKKTKAAASSKPAKSLGCRPGRGCQGGGRRRALLRQASGHGCHELVRQ